MRKEDIILNTIVFKEALDKGIKQVDLLDSIKTLGLRRVEIRREFLGDITSDLLLLKAKADELDVELFYSINEDFVLDHKIHPNLQLFCQEAALIGAPFIKLNVGDASRISLSELEEWHKQLDTGIGIRLENNQDPQFASISNCQLMMAKCQKANLPISFVFDTGNWAWVGENVFEALDALKDVSTYIHCKNYHKQEDEVMLTSLFAGDLDMLGLMNMFSDVEYIAFEYPASVDIIKKDLEKFCGG
ncbi:sugar phosphate isomerase/epimerase family protein [Streptococcus sp. zg-JUN1979]|uniref:sugar phosphate isomerase/epimerase family protein n=1 Tax=Streptococcus sp. zg-JUN1979 TaxID=3391450 RepID=UPI0039A6FC5E